ncbi:MAG: hypothetical protein P8X50_09870 [Maritimibacter sp.]
MIRLFPISAVLWTLTVQASLACTIFPEERTAAEVRRDSLPVVQGANCAFQNGGLDDLFSAGPAEDMGNGRVVQMIDESRALVIDCNGRELIEIAGPLVANTSEFISCCDPMEVNAAVRKPAGPLTLKEGDTLDGLRAAARAVNAPIDEDIAWLFHDRYGKPYRQKDRVDTLCGCKLFYPDSPGGK